MNFAPHRQFTRLDARITEEEGNFTVSVRMRNHRPRVDRRSVPEDRDVDAVVVALGNCVKRQYPPPDISRLYP